MVQPTPQTSDALHRRGLMFIMSSPSGAGKTTISRMLLEADPAICLSVSATTRPMRPGEVDGKDYHFVTHAEFDRMVENEEFLEWAHVFGNSYGTPKAQVKAGLREGRDYLFDIDWQGTQQLYQKLETDVVRVFLLPPASMNCAAASPGAAPTAPKSSPPAWNAPAPKSATGTAMTTWWSTTISTSASPRSAKSSTPNA